VSKTIYDPSNGNSPGTTPENIHPFAGNRAETLTLASKVLVIAGDLGVGKTTFVDSILRILAAKDILAGNIFTGNHNTALLK
jgi:tRNA A37 threonylcarbamoyladenosine biosynthesis protein TsaE